MLLWATGSDLNGMEFNDSRSKTTREFILSGIFKVKPKNGIFNSCYVYSENKEHKKKVYVTRKAISRIYSQHSLTTAHQDQQQGAQSYGGPLWAPQMTNFHFCLCPSYQTSVWFHIFAHLASSLLPPEVKKDSNWWCLRKPAFNSNQIMQRK